MVNETAPGRLGAWNLRDKIGEGDAGEVFLVESLLEKKKAILKRPQRSSFTGDVIRQASQIELEAQILSAIATLNRGTCRIEVPSLLDQSKPGTELSERYFVVISQAQGFSLHHLARLVYFGEFDSNVVTSSQPNILNPIEQKYLANMARLGEIPELIMLHALSETIEFLEIIHNSEITVANSHHFGIIWNDIKPEHIIWEPEQTRITLIDWGNAQYINADGFTYDLQRSRFSDYAQFIEEMGVFTRNYSTSFSQKLSWPEMGLPTETSYPMVKSLKKDIKRLLEIEQDKLLNKRKLESQLLKTHHPTIEHRNRLSEIQQEISSTGLIPNYSGIEDFYTSLAERLFNDENWDYLIELSNELITFPSLNSDKWVIINKIVSNLEKETTLTKALQDALEENWAAVLWELQRLSLQEADAIWRQDIQAILRNSFLSANSHSLTPMVAINRLIHALKDLSLQPIKTKKPEKQNSTGLEDSATSKAYDELANLLKNRILPRWTQLEPDPPNSGIDYSEIERLLPEFDELLPSLHQSVMQSLEQPIAQVKIALDAWEQKDFTTARIALRNVLMWDPDRMRLFTADKAIQSASGWLDIYQRGPSKNESLQDFVTRLELQGRELRNQVSSSQWLDPMLDALTNLRKGIEPTEVLLNHMEIKEYLGWILEFQSESPVFSKTGKIIKLERHDSISEARNAISGFHETRFGHGEKIHLTAPLDAWVPEAKGSSARVFLSNLNLNNQHQTQAAVKILRTDRAEYALPLFREEAQVLAMLRDVPGVVPLLETGYLLLDNKDQLPDEDNLDSGEGLAGTAHRFGLDSIQNFIMELNKRIDDGWIPYLASAVQEKEANLLLACDAGYTGGQFLPLMEGLRIAIQICDILESAHNRNIVYRDHKILHYFWKEKLNGVILIDWNIAQRFPEGISKSEMQFDLVQFGARALHHIITGRSAPGALPLGPTRPEDIETAAKTYSVHWTYDDRRLPSEVKDILGKVLSGEYYLAKELRKDLLVIFQTYSDLLSMEN